MEFKGRYAIPAAPAAVWAALHDPAVLKSSIPGCETLEKISETQFKAKAVIKIGPVKATFAGNVELTPHTPEPGFSHALTIKGEGQGGAAGFARGQSEVRLAADGRGTVLTYDAKANVGGKLAQIGQRLIDGAAKSLADDFFAKFASQMQTAPAVAPALPSTATPAPATEAAPSLRSGLPTAVWVVTLIAFIVLLLVLFAAVH